MKLATGLFSFFLLVAYCNADETCEDDTCVSGTEGDIHEDSNKVEDVFSEDNVAEFLKDKVFGQKVPPTPKKDSGKSMFDGIFDGMKEDDMSFNKLFDGMGKSLKSKKDNSNGDFFRELLDKSQFGGEKKDENLNENEFKAFKEALDIVLVQLNNTFGDLGLENFDPLSMMYYLHYEDALKNPSWKRRQHRMYQQIDKETVLDLHDSLYLSELAYVDTVDEIKAGVKNFKNNSWEFLDGSTDSLVKLPAHFLAVHKYLQPLRNDALQSVLPWETPKDNVIEVMLVVRGTKTVADMLSDGMLETAPYDGGHAHEGILDSGKALVKKRIGLLENLLKASKREKVQLTVIGHSLGAGAAAIAAMEFKKFDFLKVKVVGFGCPATISQDLAENTKDYITTVVTDADIVPRMSGATVANVLLKMMKFDWTVEAAEDLRHTIERLREVSGIRDLLPPTDKVLAWVNDFFEKDIRSKIANTEDIQLPVVLVPPGSCIHLFRDGGGFTGSYTPCTFFNEVDVARTALLDHLIPTGYHKALLTMMRDWENDLDFSFVHDVIGLRS